METYNIEFPCHDEDTHILYGLLRVKYSWITVNRVDPCISLSMEGTLQRITATCKKFECGSVEESQQHECLAVLGRAFWELAALQCCNTEVAL